MTTKPHRRHTRTTPDANFLRFCRLVSELTYRGRQVWRLIEQTPALRKDGSFAPLTFAENVTDLDFLTMLRDVSRMPGFEESLDRAIQCTRSRLGMVAPG